MASGSRLCPTKSSKDSISSLHRPVQNVVLYYDGSLKGVAYSRGLIGMYMFL